jgi:hypothetical protein
MGGEPGALLTLRSAEQAETGSGEVGHGVKTSAAPSPARSATSYLLQSR